MSLFRVRSWWTTRIAVGEEFGEGALCVANLDNDPSGQEKVIVGSFQGFLRVYLPHGPQFSAQDLIVEKNMEAPILQLLAGRLVPGKPNVMALAILHPRGLSVLQLIPHEEHYNELVTLYTHTWEFSACTMCCGSLGGISGRDYIAVLSMEGVLYVFEQEHRSLARKLPKLLVPGPLLYAPRIDAILIGNTQREIDCFRFGTLVSAEAGKVMKPDWTINLGEDVWDLFTARASSSLHPGETDIVALGEKTLFFIKENGGLRHQKRLDFSPARAISCSVAEMEGGLATHSVLVSSRSGGLMVFRGVQLAWAALLPTTPVSLAVSSFGGVNGLLVTLDDDGQLSVSYLGTEPPVDRLPILGVQRYGKEDAEEFEQIAAEIASLDSRQRPEPMDRLVVDCQLPNKLDVLSSVDDSTPEGIPPLSATVYLSLLPTKGVTAHDVWISVSAPSHIHVDQDTSHLDKIEGERPVLIPLRFRVLSVEFPPSMDVHVAVTHTSSTNETRVAHCEFTLPLSLVCRAVPPVKIASGHKMVMETNRDSISMASLFDDLLDASSGLAQPHIISLQFFSGVTVSLLASKNSGRYRVEAEQLDTLWLPLGELVRRLLMTFATADGIRITYKDTIPFSEYHTYVDTHLQRRKRVHDITGALEARAHQHRVVEKQLLLRLKDKNATSIENLGKLLQRTHEDVIGASYALEDAQLQLLASALRLSGATRTILYLVKLRSNLDAETFAMLQRILSPHVLDDSQQGWEERVQGACIHMLRTVLGRGAQESAPTHQHQTPTMPEDSTKLAKLIPAVCERIMRGGLPTRKGI